MPTGWRSRPRAPGSLQPASAHVQSYRAITAKGDLGLGRRIDLDQRACGQGCRRFLALSTCDRGHHCRPSLSPAIKRIAASKSPNRIG
jgi:hypothetical protein